MQMHRRGDCAVSATISTMWPFYPDLSLLPGHCYRLLWHHRHNQSQSSEVVLTVCPAAAAHLQVSGSSQPTVVAGALSARCRDNAPVCLIGIGVDAVTNAVCAAAAANRPVPIDQLLNTSMLAAHEPGACRLLLCMIITVHHADSITMCGVTRPPGCKHCTVMTVVCLMC